MIKKAPDLPSMIVPMCAKYPPNKADAPICPNSRLEIFPSSLSAVPVLKIVDETAPAAKYPIFGAKYGIARPDRNPTPKALKASPALKLPPVAPTLAACIVRFASPTVIPVFIAAARIVEPTKAAVTKNRPLGSVFIIGFPPAYTYLLIKVIGEAFFPGCGSS